MLSLDPRAVATCPVLGALTQALGERMSLPRDSLIPRTKLGGPADLLVLDRDQGAMRERFDHYLVTDTHQGTIGLAIQLDRSKVIEVIRRDRLVQRLAGQIDHLKEVRVSVEHTSINPVHSLHIGALRGSFVGSAIAAFLRELGARVTTCFYVNDLGKQTATLAAIIDRVGYDTTVPYERFAEHIGAIYAAGNMAMERRDDEVRRILRENPSLGGLHGWETLSRGYSREPIATIVSFTDLIAQMLRCIRDELDLFGAAPDSFDLESEVSSDCERYIPKLARRYPLVLVNGTLCLRTLNALIPLLRPDGSTLYFIRDVGYAKKRTTESQLCINVVGEEQAGLQEALCELMPVDGGGKLRYRKVGSVRDQRVRFSARRSRLYTARQIIDRHGFEVVRALRFNMLRVRCARTIVLSTDYFDGAALGFVERMMARARRDLGRTGPPPDDLSDLPVSDAAWGFVVNVLRTSHVLGRTTDDLEMHRLAAHAMRLAASFRSLSYQRSPLTGFLAQCFLDVEAMLLRMLGFEDVGDNHVEADSRARADGGRADLSRHS